VIAEVGRVLVERRLAVGHPSLVRDEAEELRPQVGGDGHEPKRSPSVRIELPRGRGRVGAQVMDAWYTGVADELARCLTDAESCADACESLLERTSELDDQGIRKRIVNAVVGPAAVARVLIELIDQPQQLVIAATRLCRDTSEDALAALRRFPDELVGEACATLRTCSRSCSALLEAA
jgi:hypothetical protein